VFPATAAMAQRIRQAVNLVRDSTPHEDIRTMANSFGVALEKEMRTPGRWVTINPKAARAFPEPARIIGSGLFFGGGSGG
jgi:hypothetical protein